MYAIFFKCPNAIDIEIIQLLLKVPLDVDVKSHRSFCSPIELAIDLRRFDVVKLLVRSGAHPVDPCIPAGTKAVGILQLLKEYYDFGTNTYITWLLQEHLLSHEASKFIKTVAKLDILNETAMELFAKVGRHPVHAILTCGHEKLIRKLIKHHGSSLLTIKDETGRSALQIAAKRGDMESIRILVDL